MRSEEEVQERRNVYARRRDNEDDDRKELGYNHRVGTLSWVLEDAEPSDPLIESILDDIEYEAEEFEDGFRAGMEYAVKEVRERYNVSEGDENAK